MALQLTFNYPVNRSRNRTLPFSILASPQRSSVPRLMSSGDSASISWKGEASHDPELRYVLELATDTELYEVHRILFGPSYFSPLLKSVINGGDAGEFVMIEEDLEERNFFISALESRFLFLAADARATLRGWRPTYRNVLLSVRKKLGVPCSRRLSTEDLEVEIFLHLLQEYSSEESGISPGLWENSKVNNNENSLELGVNSWKAQSLPVVKGGVLELFTMILKGSGVFTLTNMYQLLAKKFSKKLFLEAARYQIKREALKKSGQLAAINLESRAALLAAKQGFAGAASRYVGLKSMMGLLGPMLWGTFLADVVIQNLGTDYARIMRAIYAFAQELNPKHVLSLNSTVRSVSLARISYQMKMAKEIAVLSASLDPSAGI